MRIVVRTFGLPREVIASDWFEVKLSEGATVADLTKRLDTDFPQLFGMRGLAMYVNGENATEEAGLTDGDEVFFAPIVSGG